mmetsp:Transcript_41597/g.120590  ORF Transcript_41597/g.120590 Transcript_41597/m.120590 type:complete len:287 (-) Transcript_41597:187-1047(-)
MGAQCSCSDECVTADVVEAAHVEETPPALMDEHVPCMTAQGSSKVMQIPRLPLPLPPAGGAVGKVKQCAGSAAPLDEGDKALMSGSVTRAPSPSSSYAAKDDGSEARAHSTRRTWEGLDAMEEAPGSAEGENVQDKPVTLPHLLRPSHQARQPSAVAAALKRPSCEKGQAADAAGAEPARLRIVVERASVDEYLGLDVRSLADGQFLVVTVDAAGVCAGTGMFQPGDNIHGVNGMHGSEEMIAQCVESANLVFEVSRPVACTTTAMVPQRNSRPKVPPLKLPAQTG